MVALMTEPAPLQLTCVLKKGGMSPFNFMPRPELGFHPFYRAVSRLDYRTELFNSKKGAEPVKEIINLSLPSWSFEECCLHRARELLDQNREHYEISYSGGIDSTVMVVSLLRVWPEEALKKITMRLSHQSINENPSFFDQHISRFQIRSSFEEMSEVLLHSNALMVTGELGDQAFGSDLLMAPCRMFGDSILKADYREVAPKIIELAVGRPDVGRAIFEYFHPIVEECPFPIRTAFDFFWWFNFTQKWQLVKYRYCRDENWNLEATLGKHVLHFFDTPYFQKWSLNNHDLKIQDSWLSYKMPAKKFIYEYTKDENQLALAKIQSMGFINLLDIRRIAITSDNKAVERYEDLEKYVRYDF